MERNIYRKDEVIAFIEELILSNAATDEQEELYLNFQWNNKLVKNYTYKRTVSQMRKLYDEKF